MDNVSKSLLKGTQEALWFAKGKSTKAKVHRIAIPEKKSKINPS